MSAYINGKKILASVLVEGGGGGTGGLTEEEIKQLIAQETTDFVKKTDYATGTNPGVVKIASKLGIALNSEGVLTIVGANKTQIEATEPSATTVITARNIGYAVKKGLVNPVGGIEAVEWTEADREKARETLGASKKLYKHTIRLVNPNTNEDFTFTYEPIFEIITQDASLGYEQIGTITGSQLYSLLMSYFGIEVSGTNSKIGLVPFVTKDTPYSDCGIQIEETMPNKVIFITSGSGHKLMSESDTINMYITTRELGKGEV